ncbi:CDP-alcohol phosphatidyltransferase family protein [Haloferax sp. MBLA0076]|uniref:CDP-alcohol phosphatidyltransferase family protein n=1 Tax=Haloferax litoreum TaxID=2666140 RepID=A0A6A8GN34_9EURY|nr:MULTISPECIES: CDP-alcohol phosphatidyltransferase family protein [Haloferax]KAB1194642.1 CDP-alcohol phosphatidyltransferase family protein [Haloferax sp. CBA1148]MRX23220.1 CDP-alcohol phosphatidyltransferase family protein [Haloferax litoreum]
MSENSPTTTERTLSTATRQTRRRVLGSGLFAIVGVVSVGAALRSVAGAVSAARWTTGAVLVVGGLWAYTYAHAAENVHTSEWRGNERVSYETLGAPTVVTLARGVLVAGIGGLAGVAALGPAPDWVPWVAALAYGVAVVLDVLDGFLARRLNRVTELGGRLDTAVDAFGLLVAPLTAVVLGELPWWYLSVGAARYLFVAGLWWRTRTGRPTFDLPPRTSRRVLAGLQMAVVPIALAPGVADRWMPLVAGLAASGLLLGFGRDWLYVSGRIDVETPAPRTPPTKD